MKNFKVIIKTDRKNCPLGYQSCLDLKIYCSGRNYTRCTEKNCPFKEGKK